MSILSVRITNKLILIIMNIDRNIIKIYRIAFIRTLILSQACKRNQNFSFVKIVFLYDYIETSLKIELSFLKIVY